MKPTMPGLYLLLENTPRVTETFSECLQAPHVTLAHSPDPGDAALFEDLAKSVHLHLCPVITCESATLSKFTNRNGSEVYDVLLGFDERSKKQIKSLRAFLFTETPPAHWNVRNPHITFSRSWCMRDLEYQMARGKKLVSGSHEECTFRTSGVATKL